MRKTSLRLESVRNYLAIRSDAIGFLSDLVRGHGDFVRFKLLVFPYVPMCW